MRSEDATHSHYLSYQKRNPTAWEYIPGRISVALACEGLCRATGLTETISFGGLDRITGLSNWLPGAKAQEAVDPSAAGKATAAKVVETAKTIVEENAAKALAEKAAAEAATKALAEETAKKLAEETAAKALADETAKRLAAAKELAARVLADEAAKKLAEETAAKALAEETAKKLAEETAKASTEASSSFCDYAICNHAKTLWGRGTSFVSEGYGLTSTYLYENKDWILVLTAFSATAFAINQFSSKRIPNIWVRGTLSLALSGVVVWTVSNLAVGHQVGVNELSDMGLRMVVGAGACKTVLAPLAQLGIRGLHTLLNVPRWSFSYVPPRADRGKA